MPRPRPAGLHRELNRHGTVVWYVRPNRGARIRIKGDYGSPEFTLAVEAALGGRPIAAAADNGAFPGQTLGWLIAQYRGSTRWAALSNATRRQRENYLKQVIAAAGGQPVSRIDRAHIVAGRDRRGGAAGLHFMSAMRGLFAWALEGQHVDVDPTAGVKSPKLAQSGGYTVWTEEDRERYKARWPLGTRERVWFAVLYCTGLRKGDACRVGRPHVKNGLGSIRAEKNNLMVHFVVDAELAEALKAGPTGDLTFIVGARGQPLNKGSFGNSFDLACKAAGVKATAHGLRKARATSVAEAGASEAELDSMFGWRRGSHMSTVYTQDADRVLLAESGAQKLAQKSNVYSRTLLPGAGIKPKRSKVSKT